MLEKGTSTNSVKFRKNKHKVNHMEEKQRPQIPGGTNLPLCKYFRTNLEMVVLSHRIRVNQHSEPQVIKTSVKE